ncbi:hypothetical protein CNR22_06335 [Sphingobacteriaceae bacterium]|nr:hypothetical protein CNR22_06335 [Sphingobacteriaceae bacterium]
MQVEKEIIKKYSNGEVTIVWKPSACIHSTLCWKGEAGLPDVFNPRIKPWINPNGASSEKIVAQVKKCPSGALSYFYNEVEEKKDEVVTEIKIEAVLNGPLLVYGNVLVKDSKGNEAQRNNVTALCRCGKSENKPYCDGNHIKHNFEG